METRLARRHFLASVPASVSLAGCSNRLDGGLMFSEPIQVGDADWPQYRSDAAHSRRTPAAVGEHLTPRPPHRTTTEGVLAARPVVADGLIFLAHADGSVRAVREQDGETHWHVSTGADVISETAVHDGRLLVGAKRGLVELDRTGSVRSRVDVDQPLRGGLKARNDVVYTGTGDGRLLAVNRGDGSIRWSEQVDTIAHGVAVTEKVIVVGGGSAGRATALEPDGRLAWEFERRGQGISQPAIGPEGKVFLCADDGAVYALDPADGTVEWSTTVAADGVPGYVTAPGPNGMFVAMYRQSAEAWSVAGLAPDGTLRWERRPPLVSGPIGTADHVVIETEGGVAVLAASDGRTIASVDGIYSEHYAGIGATLGDPMVTGEGIYVARDHFEGAGTKLYAL